jgi:tetratricopeptide (TPR) repeat protein
VAREEEVSGALVVEGNEHLEAGRLAAARDSFQLAVEFDAEMPHAWFGLANVAWASGERGEAVAALRKGLSTAWLSWVHRMAALHVMAWLAVIAMQFAVWPVSLILLLRHLPLVHHGLSERWRKRLPPTTNAVAAGILPWMILIVPWGLLWAPAAWFGLSGPFLSRRERWAAGAVVLLALLSAASMGPLSEATRWTLDPRMVQVATAAQGAATMDRHRTLMDLVERDPKNAVLQFLLADQIRAQGRPAEALKAYDRAADLDPSLYQVANNRGTLLFGLGRYASAVPEFRKAIDAHPEVLTPHYNLYLTQQQRFDFTAAEQTLAAAREIDEAGITSLLANRAGHQARLDVLETRVEPGLAMAHARSALEGDVTTSLASTVKPSWPMILAMVSTLTALLLTRSRPFLPSACAGCGRVACRACSFDASSGPTCGSCLALALRKSSLPAANRARKKEEIAAYQRRRRRTSRILAMIFPGAGHLWAGRVFMGLPLMLVSSCAAYALLRHAELPVVAVSPDPSLSGAANLVAVVVLAFCFLTSFILPTVSHHALPARGASREG